MKKLIAIALFTLFQLKMQAQCWSLVWQDDFNGTSLNADNWTPWIGPAYNNELQYYTGRPENLTVENGLLKIVARAESYNGHNYTSGRIESRQKVDFTYGRVESRMKLVEGQGLWPAFWLLPTAGNWPAGGEIDIMELLGHEPNKTYGTCHYTVAGQHASMGSNYVLPTGNFANGFHTLAVEWSPTSIKWQVDGTTYYTVTKTQVGNANWPFTKDFYVILNLAVGGDWPGNPDGSTVFPATMEVDWVKIYQTNPNIKIKGPALAEPNSGSIYKLPAWTGATYNWTVSAGGTITGGQNSPNLNVQWGAAGDRSVSCSFTNACGTRSTSFPVKVTPNLWANPSFEQGNVNWNFQAYGGGAGSFAVAGSTTAPDGLKVGKVVSTALGGNFWNIQLTRSGIAVKKDTSYTFKFWAKANANGKKTQVNFLNPTNFTNYAWQNITLSTLWTQYSLNFVAPYTGNLLFTQDFGFHLGTFFTDHYYFGRTSQTTLPIVSDVRAPADFDFEKSETPDFQVFPNPVRDEIQLKNAATGQWALFDLTGRQAMAGQFAGEAEARIWAGDLPDGLYFLKIETGDGRTVLRKIFKSAKP